MKIEKIYLDGSYLKNNRNWDREDAAWKANIVSRLLRVHSLAVGSICEVGCGAGDVLRHLRKRFPSAKLSGFDISPQLLEFWEEDKKAENADNAIRFELGDFHEINNKKYDVLLMLDVFEHVRDPFTFLESTRRHSKYFVFHIPLDLSAFSVSRGGPLLNAWKQVGHLNYYTKDLALETLEYCGYRIVDWKYTGASLSAPNRSFKTRVASIPRRILYSISKDAGVRILGGETLLVLAT